MENKGKRYVGSEEACETSHCCTGGFMEEVRVYGKVWNYITKYE